MKNSFISKLNKKQLEIDNKYDYSNKNINIELKEALKLKHTIDSSLSIDIKNKNNKESKEKEISNLSSNLKYISSKNKSIISYSKNKSKISYSKNKSKISYSKNKSKISYSKNKSKISYSKNKNSEISNKIVKTDKYNRKSAPLLILGSSPHNKTILTNFSKEKSSDKSTLNSNIKKRFKSRIDHVRNKKKGSFELKNELSNKMSKTPKNRISKGFIFNINYAKDIVNNRKSRQIDLIKETKMTTSFPSYDYYNEDKIIKIQENIQNEIGSKELKKKLHLMRQSIVHLSSSKNNRNFIIDGVNLNEKSAKNDEDIIKNEENENIDESKIYLKNNSKSENVENTYINKYRRIKRIKELYDSFDDDEYEDEENNDYYISPNSFFIKVFDCIILIFSLFYLIFVPYFFSTNIIITDENKLCKYLLIIIDIIYIIDIILNFFRPYQNFDENFIIKSKFIFLHYIKTWFFFDFIQSIPFFTTFKFLDSLCNKNHNEDCTFDGNNKVINQILYIIILLKIIKVYKLFNDNSTISMIQESLSQYEIIDNYGSFIFSIFFSLCSVNVCACLFIFIGQNSYPNWLTKINIQNESYISIYITSVYFILVTITTVGYGDITGNSYAEIVFQMFLLIIGTIAYSFVISFFSNYIVKKNQKSMTFEKNVSILDEIKLYNPNLKNSVYREVLKNLHNEQLYEKNDKSILFDCLPYSLKNKLIMEMFKPIIDNFIFFKDTENSDFIVKVVTSLKPLLSFKGDILVQEGDFIKEIFFVKKGSLALNIAINKESPEESIRKYLGVNQRGKINVAFAPSIIDNYKRNSIFNFDDNIYNFVTMKNQVNDIIKEENELNLKEIKLIEIRDNEHFGIALMFLNERSPLIVKVKTKIAELLVLKKMEAIEIHSIYPNIWKRINKKSLYNMEQIKLKIKQELLIISNKYGSVTQKNILQKSKSLKNFIDISFLNESKNSQIQINTTKKNKKRKKSNKTQDLKNLKKNYNIDIIKATNYKEGNKKKEDNKALKDNINKEEKTDNENKKQMNDIITKANHKDILNKSHISESNFSTSGIRNKNNSIIKNKTKSQLNENEKSVELGQNSKKKIKETKDITKINNELEKIELNNTILNTLISNSINQKNGEYKNNKNLFSLPTKLNHEESVVDNSMICNDSNINNRTLRTTIKNESEKIISNSFSNLTTTKEKSFQLNSSYENLNEITKNRYIKDNNLQTKTKQFLVNECSLTKNDSGKGNNLLLLKNPVIKKISILPTKSLKNITNQFDLEQDKRSVNSVILSNLKSNRENKNSNDSNYGLEKIKTLKNSNSIKNNSFKRIISLKQSVKNNLFNCPSSKFKCKSPSPRRKKNAEVGVNKKLNIISQNIKGANKNINNPNEFYMDFFNNIIKQKTFGGFNLEKKNNIENSKDKTNNLNSLRKNSLSPKKQINSVDYWNDSNRKNQGKIK